MPGAWIGARLPPLAEAPGDVEDEEVVAVSVGAVQGAPAMLVERVFFFLNWKRKLSSSSSARALSELGVPKSDGGLGRAGLPAEPLAEATGVFGVFGACLAGLPAEPLAEAAGVFGVFGARGAGDVNIRESSRGGIPTVKSSLKSTRLEDSLRRCAKARWLLLAEFADFLGSGTPGPFPCRARKNL